MEDHVKIIMIPNEMIKIIPLFDGDKRHLNLFIRKSEYIINKYRGSDEQNLYVMHAITSRLAGNAAALISEREDIVTWEEFKELLIQHFGDPRSEECLAIELETLRIRNGESFLDFCNRIQSVRSILISKVNRLSSSIRESKITIYNNTSLNVFLYNLPENMVRIVRLKAPSTLEQALSFVLEEVNFHDQYNARNKTLLTSSSKHDIPNNTQTFKFGTNNYNKPINNNTPIFTQPNTQPKLNFGNPQGQQFGMRPQLFEMRPQQFGIRPQQFGTRTPQFGFQGQTFGYRPQEFGMRPQQFGMRPQQFGMRPQHFGMRPQNFGMSPQQFGNQQPFGNQNQSFNRPSQSFGIQQPKIQSSDVTMRTAPPGQVYIKGFKLNELDLDHYDDSQYPCDYEYNDEYYHDYYPVIENQDENYLEEVNENVSTENKTDFQLLASETIEK